MTEEEWEKLYEDFNYWVVDLKDAEDPPDYERAADILLGWLQQHCTHPIRLYSYQLSSLTHFASELHSTKDVGLIPFSAFQHLCRSLLCSCNEGRLPDARIVSN